MSLNTILATTPLVSTNYILKATGTTIGNSLIWDNGTNVGIGNTNTSYTLDVSGTLRNTTSAYFATTSGSVGIGTTNTNNVKLEVSATTVGGAEYSAFTTNQDGGVASKYSFWRTYGGGSTAFRAAYIANYNQDDSNSSANDQRLVFATKSGTAEPTTKMTITGSGNVGIGTSSPSKLFTVVASADGQTAGISGATYGLRFDNGGSFAFGGSTIHGVDNTLTATYQILGLNGSQVIFGTSGTERMRITSGGNVLLGDTTTTNYKFIIGTPDTGTSNWGIGVFNSAGSTLMRVRNDGLFYCGNAASSPYNNTYGNVANTYIGSDGAMGRSTASSQRFKENINEWDGNGLDTILALKPKTFTYKADYYKHPEIEMLGLIAEEVAEVSEYLADFENEDRTGQVENVRYAFIVVPLIKAIQEQQAQIQSLQEQINILAK